MATPSRSAPRAVPAWVGWPNYCIHNETPYARGLTWWQALDTCLADGFALCSQTQVVNALRAGVLRQYSWSEGNSWYTTASQAENSLGSSGENPICDVQGNSNEGGHPAYTVQCQHDKSSTATWRTIVCCY